MGRPVELPCGHMFCADCLLRLVTKERSYRNRECPICRGQLFILPEDAFEDSDWEDRTNLWACSRYLTWGWFDWFVYCSCDTSQLRSLERTNPGYSSDDDLLSVV